jgi:hypothetical protein
LNDEKRMEIIDQKLFFGFEEFRNEYLQYEICEKKDCAKAENSFDFEKFYRDGKE